MIILKNEKIHGNVCIAVKLLFNDQNLQLEVIVQETVF